MNSRSEVARGILSEGGLAQDHIRMGPDEAARTVASTHGLTGEAQPLATEKDDTFRLLGDDGPLAIVKVTNPADAPTHVDFQLQLLLHAGRRDPTLLIPRPIRSRDGQALVEIVDDAGQHRRLYVLSHLNGIMLKDASSSPQGREQVGETLARLRLALADFDHPGASRRVAWDLRHLTDLRPLSVAVTDPARRAMLETGLDRLEPVRDQLLGLRTQVVHNDLNRSNIIVDPGGPRFVTGIIDFGDAVRTGVAIDAATALTGQLPPSAADITDDPQSFFGHGKDLLRGYLRVAELTEDEVLLLPHLITGRLLAHGLIATWRARSIPDNADRILVNDERKWAQLAWLLARSPDQLSATFLHLTR